MERKARTCLRMSQWMPGMAIVSMLTSGGCAAQTAAADPLDQRGNEVNEENDPGPARQESAPVDLSVFKDPGKGPWQPVPENQVAARCKMDPAKLRGLRLGSGFAVVRYGQLCYQSTPNDAPSEMWSATKVLGGVTVGVASYQTRDIPRTGPRTGQLKDTDKALHWLPSVTYNREATVAHVLNMVGHNRNLAYGAKTWAYDAIGSVQINSLSNMVRTAISQDASRLGTSTGAFARKFIFDELGMTRSTWAGTVFAYTWSATLGDMARLGTLMIHQGVWAGKRVLDPGWVYKQTHPAFEDSNTAYGYLTWVMAKEGQYSAMGPFNGQSTGGLPAGLLADSCSPAAIWQRYPHGLSPAKDCTYKTNSCNQKYDVGVWSAQGLGGQMIIGHPGLDLVLVVKNYTGDGVAGLWKSIRPALVALDPQYRGDEAAFCRAYAAGDYAPDLPAPVVQPAD